jgi:peptide-methionine (S)-S-oxide reductase
MNELFFAGGCLWGVQEFFRYVPGVMQTQAGRANGSSQSTAAPYDGYAECVRLKFDPDKQTVPGLMHEFFKIIDPYSVDQQGADTGRKYRTGVYSKDTDLLLQVSEFINSRSDRARIVVEVLPLSNFVASDPEHQDRLLRCPDDYCHISTETLYSHRDSCKD